MRTVALGEVLSERRTRVAVTRDATYPMAGVYGFGRGVLIREPVLGSAMRASHLYRIEARQIIYSRLKAFEGAFALVPESANGRFVSNEFPTFDVDSSAALPEFVALALARPSVWKAMSERITGVGARRERLQVREFLEFEILLPSLEIQRGLVRDVGATEQVASASIGEARAALGLTAALCEAASTASEARTVRVGDIADLELDRVDVKPDVEYPIVGAKIAGEGLFWRDSVRGSETAYTKLNRLHQNHLVYRKLTAWEGPITVVAPEFEGAFVSPEFPTFALDLSQVEPDYVRFVCTQPWFHQEMRSRSTGTAERRSRLKPEDLLEVEMPLPPRHLQADVAVAHRLVLALHAEAAAVRRLGTAVRDAFFADMLDSAELGRLERAS
jgi:type I restriction enzyme S subunit